MDTAVSDHPGVPPPGEDWYRAVVSAATTTNPMAPAKGAMGKGVHHRASTAEALSVNATNMQENLHIPGKPLPDPMPAQAFSRSLSRPQK